LPIVTVMYSFVLYDKDKSCWLGSIYSICIRPASINTMWPVPLCWYSMY